MALPTPTQLKTMDYAYQAQPFVYVGAKSTIDLKTMDYAYQAQPFVANYSTDAPVGWSHKINGVTPAKINGVAVAGISKVNGVA
jgi:hypothetical protein